MANEWLSDANNSWTDLLDENDTVYGNGGYDTLRGAGGNDYLFGGNDNDILYGESGNDYLSGDSGDDSLYGGIGDDQYVVDSSNDYTLENSNSGYDAVYAWNSWTLGNNFEKLVLQEGVALNGTGNDLNNQIYGNWNNNVLTGLSGNDELYGLGGNDSLDGGNGNDKLDGGQGNDTMVGGQGNDDYYVDSLSDKVIEAGLNTGQSATDFSSSSDRVHSIIDWSIELLPNIEFLLLENTWSDDGSGNYTVRTPTHINGIGNNRDNIIQGSAGNNRLEGLDGNDRLFGEEGNDTLIGGDGDDWYFVDSTDDVIIENGVNPVSPTNWGDWVVPTVSYTLGANLEALHLDDKRIYDQHGNIIDTIVLNINGTGNELRNNLEGNGGNNILKGLGEDDRLDGREGNDTLIGGQGFDYLEGDAGNDVFVYESKNDSTSTNPDIIKDFENNDILKFEGIGGITLRTTAFAWKGSETATFSAIRSDATINNAAVFYTDGTNSWLTIKGKGSGVDFDNSLIKLENRSAALTTASVILPPGEDLAAPVLLLKYPADNSKQAAKESNIILTFDEEIVVGSGNILIHDITESKTAGEWRGRVISVTDSRVKINGRTLTVDPGDNLAAGHDFEVTFGSGLVTDKKGNSFNGLLAGELNFATVSLGTTFSISDAAANAGEDLKFTWALDQPLSAVTKIFYKLVGATLDGIPSSYAIEGIDYIKPYNAMYGTIEVPKDTQQGELIVHTLKQDTDPLKMVEVHVINVQSESDLPIFAASSFQQGSITTHTETFYKWEAVLHDASAFEGNDLVFKLNLLNGPCSEDLTFTYKTANRTAKAVEDYRGVGLGQLVIPKGASSGEIRIETLGDNNREGTETMELVLKSIPSGGKFLTDTEAQGKIGDTVSPAIVNAKDREVLLPFKEDFKTCVTQGNPVSGDGGYSHSLYPFMRWAIDFKAAYGTNVLAVASGTIVDYENTAKEGTNGTTKNGNLVTMKFDDGSYGSYFHLSYNSIPDSLTVGTRIQAGTLLGTVGKTGISSGPHLHVQFGSNLIASGKDNKLLADGDKDNIPAKRFSAIGTDDAVYAYDGELISENKLVISKAGDEAGNKFTAGLSEESVAYYGNGGNDTLEGGSGDDLLVGGDGSDTLTGHDGYDTFLLTRSNQADTITDFNFRKDVFLVDIKGFSSLTNIRNSLELGTIKSSMFDMALRTDPNDSNPYFFYSNTAGSLIYMSDGTGKGTPVFLAFLENKPEELTYRNFQLFDSTV